MRANGDTVLLGQQQGFVDDHGIASMKTTGDAGLIDKWHYLFVAAHAPSAKTLAEVAV